jgi:hypothetical protein
VRPYFIYLFLVVLFIQVLVVNWVSLPEYIIEEHFEKYLEFVLDMKIIYSHGLWSTSYLDFVLASSRFTLSMEYGLLPLLPAPTICKA